MVEDNLERDNPRVDESNQESPKKKTKGKAKLLKVKEREKGFVFKLSSITRANQSELMHQSFLPFLGSLQKSYCM